MCCKIEILYPNFLTEATKSVYATVFSWSLVLVFEITSIMELCMKAAVLVTYPIPRRLISDNQ